VSAIAIAVAVIAAILFWWYGNMQRWYQHLSRTSRKGPQQAEAGGVMKLFSASLKEDLSSENREVLETIVRMNSMRHLTSLFEDRTEKFYLFEALTDPSRYPWEGSGEPPEGTRPKKKVARQAG
jgi:hypothetical protein